MYASWSFVMFLITLSITLVNEFDFKSESIHLLVISLMLVKLGIYFFVENFAMYKYCKFVFTPWLIYGLFLSDMVFNPSKAINKNITLVYMPLNANYELSEIISLLNLNYFLEICLMSVFVFLLICKIVKFVWNELFHQKIFLNSF